MVYQSDKILRDPRKDDVQNDLMGHDAASTKETLNEIVTCKYYRTFCFCGSESKTAKLFFLFQLLLNSMLLIAFWAESLMRSYIQKAYVLCVESNFLEYVVFSRT